uniref:Uncharacterized protein n=1 Tax=Glossina pallidipes TaxID=7398 RepID=A0A1A9Z364_GLOPL
MRHESQWNWLVSWLADELRLLGGLFNIIQLAVESVMALMLHSLLNMYIVASRYQRTERRFWRKLDNSKTGMDASEVEFKLLNTRSSLNELKIFVKTDEFAKRNE